MTNEEAQFRLQGYRPDGSDAQDPAFAEALAQAECDPALRAWFAREREFDGVVAGHLATVKPPPGLRESILAGTRMSSTPPPANSPAWWRQPWFYGLAAAATLAVLLSLVGIGPWRPVSEVTGNALFRVALADMAGAHPGDSKHADMLGGFGAWLENSANRLAADTMPITAAQLRSYGCRTLDLAGREVFEICFTRNGAWYHVYLAPRPAGALPRAIEPYGRQQDELFAMTWADEQFVYMVSSTTSADDLQALL